MLKPYVMGPASSVLWRDDYQIMFLRAFLRLNFYLSEDLSLFPLEKADAYHLCFLRESDRERDRPRCIRPCGPFFLVEQGGVSRIEGPLSRPVRASAPLRKAPTARQPAAHTATDRAPPS